MPYDGSTWVESLPDNNTLANEIDDNMRDMKQGTSARMRLEHHWPTSQTGTGEGGRHTFVTLAIQTAAPTLPVVASNTQVAAIWASSGSMNVLIEGSAGNSAILYNSAKNAVSIISGVYSATGTAGEMVIGSSGGQLKILAPGSSGQILTAYTTADVAWASNTGVAWGAFGARSFGTTYQATSDGFVFGNTTATSASHEFTAYQDANATPSTVVQKGSIVWVGGGQAVCVPVAFPVKKDNYYSVVGSGASGTMQFVPMGA